MTTATTSVAGTIATDVLTSASNSASSSSSANTTLSGLLLNLEMVSDPALQAEVAMEIIRTPGLPSGAVMIAEKLIADLKIADPVARAEAVRNDVQALQAVATLANQSTSTMSKILSALGF